MNKINLNYKKYCLILLICLIPGCKQYNISNAESAIYTRKSLISSGKIKITGMSTDANGNILIKDLQAMHNNAYLCVDIDAKNIKLTKEEFKEIIEK